MSFFCLQNPIEAATLHLVIMSPQVPLVTISQTFLIFDDLGSFEFLVEDQEAWRAAVHGVTKSGHDLVTEQQQQEF